MFRQALRRFGVDRAVTYAMAARVWQIPSAMITTLLVAITFDPTERGIYVLLLGQTGLQALADAGLLNTILHAASHEAAGSRFDRLGFLRAPRLARHRLAGLIRFGLIWFSIAAVALFLLGFGVGYALLAKKGYVSEGALPLALAMTFASLSLALAPLVAVLEGCNQVQTVNRYRLGQAITGSLTVWAVMTMGLGLWAPAAAIAVQLCWECILLVGRYGKFMHQVVYSRKRSSHLKSAPNKLPDFDWRKEIWPLQWRIAIQSVVRYLAFYPIIPILFVSAGPEVAGRYGMTWQVLNNLLMVAYVYVRTKSPGFGRLIAEGKREESTAAFRSSTIGSTIVLIVSATAFCVSLGLFAMIDQTLINRIQDTFLPVGPAILLALALIPIHFVQCFSIYIRSHKFDSVWRVSIPTNLLLTIGVCLAAQASWIEGIAFSMLVTFGGSAVTLWLMCRWYDMHFTREAAAATAD